MLIEFRARLATGERTNVLLGLMLDRVATGAELLGGASRASAALPVIHGHASYLITAEPEAYPGIDVICIER